VVLLEELAPAAVAELGGAGGRADEVGEEDGGQHAIRSRGLPSARDELPDLGEGRVGVEPGDVVLTRKLHVVRAADHSSEKARVLYVADLIVGRVNDERRNVDRRRDVADIDPESHPGEACPCSRRGGMDLEPPEPGTTPFDVPDARREA